MAERAAEVAREEEQEAGKHKMASKLTVLTDARPKQAQKRSAKRPEASKAAPRKKFVPLVVRGQAPAPTNTHKDPQPQEEGSRVAKKGAGAIGEPAIREGAGHDKPASNTPQLVHETPTSHPEPRNDGPVGREKPSAKPRVKASDIDLAALKTKVDASQAAGQISKLTVPELRAWLKSNGMAVGGKKMELETRLLDCLRKRAEVAAEE